MRRSGDETMAGRIAGLARRLGLDLSPRRRTLLALIAAGALATAMLPIGGPGPNVSIALAVVMATVALLATSALPGHVTACLFFAAALGLGVAPPLSILSGFWANATMLIFGGLIIGTAAERSGLGRYIARNLMQRFTGSYVMLLTGMLVGTFVLSFLLPSTMARLAITIPIVLAVCKEAGYEPGSPGYIGAVMTTVAGNFTTSYAILPANLTNVIVIGTAESVLGVHMGYVEYLALAAPVLGLAKGISFIALVLWVFPAPKPAVAATDPEPVPLSFAARRLAVVLAMTVALWSTDVLHGLKPGWIAMGAAILCLLPPLALVRLAECFDPNRISAVMIVPAIQGVAAVLTHSGAGALIAGAITTLAPLAGGSPVYGFVVIAVVSCLMATVATVVGTIAIVTPIISDVATATGLPVRIGLLAQINGLQAPLFHYVATPILVGTAMGGVSPRAAIRLLVPAGIVGLLVIMPLHIAWLKLIGAMP